MNSFRWMWICLAVIASQMICTASDRLDPVAQTAWAPVVAENPARPMTEFFEGKYCCFAPGTDPAYVDHHSLRLYGDPNDPLSYFIYNRWTSTASGGTGSLGDPITLTYSFVPDGVTVPDEDPPDGWGDHPSAIYATMNGQAGFPNEAYWKGLFADAFQWWTDLTGITFVETVDDGASLYDPDTGYGHSPGVLGVRGDIRIAAAPMDGSSGVLAYNRFPNIGDMVMDVAENWDNSAYSYGFLKNIVAHELGHAIGLLHVCPNGCTILMDPYLCSSIGGPQHDDIRGGQRNYGDPYEPNDASGTATDLGLLVDGMETVTHASSDDNGDQDWYEFEVGADRQVEVLLDLVGASYLHCSQTSACTCSVTLNTLDDANLAVYLYDSDGSTVLASASGQPAGIDEFISAVALPSAGTYFVRVTSGATNEIQMYDLDIIIGPNTLSNVTVTSPNGGESWQQGDPVTITWTSTLVTGNVSIEINDDYPGGSWNLITASTANDGSEGWTVTAPASTDHARVRVTSINEPLATDVSDDDFTIVVPSIEITRPNGGETLNGEAYEVVTWTTDGVTGNIVIEVDRDFPSGSWEYVDTVPDEIASILFGGPATTQARMRLTSVNEPDAVDTSDADFEIEIIDLPPEVTHDPRADDEPGAVTFVALITDDHAVVSAHVHHRLIGAGAFDSTGMSATGNPDEYSADVGLAIGRYDYFLRAFDGTGQYAVTDTLILDIGLCGDTIAYDDGGAEGFNWAAEVEYEWAVRFDPGGYPYLLCGLEVAIARVSPDSLHSPMLAKVFDSDGAAGLPGTLLWSEESGSIGNAIGGLAPGTLHWATVLVDSGSGTPLTLNQPFYVSVSNPVSGKYEAFGRDDDTPTGGTSFFYEGCDFVWLSESDAHANAQGGTRMIRALGYSLATPEQLVIYPVGNDIHLHWSDSGAPYFRIYSATTPDGPFSTLEGSTDDTSFVDVGVVPAEEIRFYHVVGSVNP